MISRRQLFGGLALLPMAGGLASCAARASVTAPASGGSSGGGSTTPVSSVTPPYVAPGAAWNGAAKSGGVPAVFPGGNVSADPIPRTTAKPAIHWLVPSGRVLAPGADLVIGVDADAGGKAGSGKSGVKQVDFWVEGTLQTITAPGFYADTDANGNPRTRYGYWIKLRQSDFAAHLGGEVRIFATAIPNDTSMQSRIIGYDRVNGSGGVTIDGNYPMSVYPRAQANDRSYTVNPSNNDVSPNFKTLKKAITQAGADNAEFPLITFTATASYEAENAPIHASGKGFCTITHASGVVATIMRAAPFIPNNPTSWNWTPGWDGIEFRGQGILFQQDNWAGLQLGRDSWFNGCRFARVNARDTNLWNNAQAPYGGAVAAAGFGTLMNFHDNVDCQKVSGVFNYQHYAIGCTARNIGGSIFSGTHYVYNTYVRDYSNAYFRQTGVMRLRIRYNNPGGHSSATVSRTNSYGPGATMTLKVDGATVATIPLGYYSTDTNPTVTQVAAAINAVGNGWTATVLNDGAIWPGASIYFNGGDWTANNLNAFGVNLDVNATPDPHGEWWQGYTGGDTRQNVILRNNIVRENVAEPHINNDAATQYDTILKGNVWLGTGNSQMYLGGAQNSHYVIENNTTDCSWMRREYVYGDPNGSPDPGDQLYTSIRSNVVGPLTVFGYNGSGTHFPYSSPWVNNIIASGNVGITAADGPKDTGNFNYSLSSLTFSQLFRDYANGDLRPTTSGFLVSHLMPTINVFDALGATAGTTDVAGAWSQNAPAKVYPF